MRHHRHATTPEAMQPTTSGAPQARSALLEVTGSGFVPGEDVALAPILIHTSARTDGTVRSLVELDEPAAEVLAFGRVSGTVRVVKAPA